MHTVRLSHIVTLVLFVTMLLMAPPTLASKPPAKNKKDAPMVFTLNALPGTFIARDSGPADVYDLTLYGVRAEAFWFSTRPYPHADSLTTEEALMMIGFSASKENPLGWYDTGRTCLRQACLDWIVEVWNDCYPAG
jgi:hypothetical protein